MYAFSLNLNAQCTLNLGPNLSICAGGQAYLGGNISLTGATGGITSYQWDQISGGSLGTSSGIFVNPSATTSYSLTVTAPGCVATSDIIQVSINAGPCLNPQFTLPAGPVCDNVAVPITNTTAHQAGNTYIWVFGDGTTSNVQNPGSHVFNLPPGLGTTNITVTLIVTNAAGQTNIEERTILVQQVPDPPTLASAQLINFNGINYLRRCTSTATGVISITDATPSAVNAWATNFTIDWGDGSPLTSSATEPITPQIHTYSLGTYTLTYSITGANGCLVSNTYQVFVGNTPSIGLNGQQVDTCAAYTASYQIGNVSNNVAGTFYEVTYNDGSPVTTFNHPPPASFTHTFTTTSCGNASPNFTNAFFCTIKAINPCGEGQATIEPIRISTPPIADFNINPNPACINSPVTIANTADPGDAFTVNGCTSNYKLVWSISPATGWTLNSGTFGSTNSTTHAGWTTGTDNLNITFSVVGTYQITQLIGNSFCGDNVITQTVCVVPPIVADFTTTSNGICAPVIVTTDNLSTNVAACAPPIYAWSISPTAGYQSGNSNSFEPSFLLTNDGIYTVTLSTTNACGTSTDNATYTVVSPPTVAISTIVPGCSPYTVDPFATYDAGGGVLTIPTWTFANGSPPTFSGTNPGNVTFTNTGNNVITVEVSNQCATATNSISVFVSDAPQISVADFSVCSGSLFTINNGNPVLVGGTGTFPYTYNWSGAGGSSSISNPGFTLINLGTNVDIQTLTLTATDNIGCSSTDIINVSVLPLPVLDLQTSVPANEICFGADSIALSITSDIAGTNFTWSPSFGASATSGSQINVNPTITTNYTVVGQDPATGCSSSIPFTVTVNALPIVDAGNNIAICSSGIAVIFIDQTPLGGVWTDPTPLTGTLNPDESYIPDAPGTRDTLIYTFTDANGCTVSDWLAINVIAPNPPNAGLDTSFCLNALSYRLDTGSPFGGIWTGPGVEYTAPDTNFVPSLAGVGIHELIYTIDSGNTCEISDTILVEVFELPTLIIPLDQEVCSRDTISFEATANGGTYPYAWAWFPALWTPGSTADSTITMIPVNPSSFNLFAPITIEITDSNNCVVSNWFELTIRPLPVITAGPDTSICFSPLIPYTLSGFSPSSGAISWFGIPSNLGSLNGLDYSSGGSGTDSLVFSFTDALGCTSFDTLLIEIISPTALDAGNGFRKCESDAPVLLLSPQPANPPAQFNAYWTGPGVTNIGTDYFFDPSLAGAGSFVLTYIYETGVTCASSDTIHVAVGALPVVNAGVNANVCAGQTISLSGSIIGGAAPFVYQWSPSAGLSATNILNPDYSDTDVGSIVPLLQNFTLTVSDSFNCVVSNFVTISVIPNPQVIAPDFSFCSHPVAETLNGAAPAGGVWTSNDFTISSGNSLTPGANGLYSALYTYTDANGCVASDASTITVNAAPTVSIGPDLEVCIFSGTITFTSDFISVPEVWSGDANASGEFTPTTAGTFQAIYVTGLGSCASKDTVEILVNPLPVVDAGPNLNVCNSLPQVISNGQNPTTGGIGVWSGAGINAGTFDASGLPIGSTLAYYQFTNSITGCAATDSTQITIRTSTELAFVSTQLNYCFTDYQNNLVQAGASPEGGVWTGNGVSQVGSIYNFEAPSIGTTILTYTYTNAFGCISDSSITANIIAPLNASANNGADIEFCFDADTLYALSATPAGGSWLEPSWLSSNGTFNGGLTDTTIAVYTVGTLDCQTWDTISIIVHALPLTESGLDQVDCINVGCVQLQDFQPITPAGLPVSGAFWSGDGSITPNGIFCPNQSLPGINQLIYTYTEPQTGCTSHDTMSYFVHPTPVANIDLPAAFCLGAPYNLQNISIGDTTFPGPFQSQWTVWDYAQNVLLTSSAVNPTFTFPEVGNYSIQLVVTTSTGCIDTINANVQSVDLPVASFSLSADTVCAPETISIINSTIGFGVLHSWNIPGVYTSTQALPDALVLPAPVLNDTTFVVFLDVTNLCGADQFQIPIFARVSPTPMFTVDAPSGCSPFVPVFNNISYGQPDSFFWDLGDGTTFTSVVPVNHAFIAIDNDTTEYLVQLIVENQCRIDTMTMIITALPNTVTSFFNTDPPGGCAPLTVNFTNVSGGSTDYLWDFGDGSPLQTAEDFSHTYQTGGIFTISLVSSDACSIDTSYAQVNVFAVPQVAFTLDQNVFCLGNTLSINNLSTGAVAFSWSFGNGEGGVGFEPLYEYPAAGDFQIRLIGYSPVFACPDTTFQNATIQAFPIIDIVANPASGCAPLNVQFVNNTQFSTISIWDFGNGLTSTSFSPSTTYSAVGTYIAKLTSHNYDFASNLDCSTFDELPITVFPTPSSSFTTSSQLACGPPAATSVQNLSSGAFAYIWTWENLQSLQFEPNIVFSDTGMKVITLVASNEYSCSDTTTSFFDVIGQPDPNLRIAPPAGCAPLSVEFESLTTYGDEWFWDFGDGSTSNSGPLTNHDFPIPGTYNVSLRIGNENECLSDTLVTSAVIVHPRAIAAFTITPDIISASNPLVTYTNQSFGASDYFIETGDGLSYSGFISQHIYDITTESSFVVTLIANNGSNCPDTLSKEITVAPSPSIYIPNSFTPNGDGNNDSFGPIMLEKPIIYNFLIFDRWGNLVFETLDRDLKWDGTMFNNGVKPIKEDVYVYKLMVAFEPENIQQLYGNVTVIY
jgi:gliding motility-associated-like protein